MKQNKEDLHVESTPVPGDLGPHQRASVYRIMEDFSRRDRNRGNSPRDWFGGSWPVVKLIVALVILASFFVVRSF